MKLLKKRILSLGLAITLALGCCSVMGTVQAQAATKNYMGSLKLKELKANTKYKIKTTVGGTKQKQTSEYYIANLKKTNAKKKGYKKLTFTFCVDSANVTQSKSAIHKLSYYRGTNGEQRGSYYAIVDAATGKDLEIENDVNVTCSNSEWKYRMYPKQEDSHGCWVRYTQKAKVNVTVVYPASYKNLGIIIGMYDTSDFKNGKTETAFWNGTKKFSETKYYKQAKKYSYYMKVK